MEKKTYLMIIVIGIYNIFLEPGETVFIGSRYYTQKIMGDASMDIQAELNKFQEKAYTTLTDDLSNKFEIPVEEFKTELKLDILQLTVTVL